MPFYIYILECSDKSYYVGCTNNLETRLKQHNESKSGAHYTKTRRPVILKYSEKYPTKVEAMKREYELKQWTKAKKEAFYLFLIPTITKTGVGLIGCSPVMINLSGNNSCAINYFKNLLILYIGYQNYLLI